MRESKERIEVDRPRVTELPKTLSIDALTSAEVLDIQRSVYLISLHFGPNVTDSWKRSPAACMQWLFLRLAPNEPWRTVGVHGGGPLNILKVNGALRHVLSASYEIPNESSTVRNGLLKYRHEVPGQGPGYGAVTLISMRAFSTYTQGQDQSEEISRLFRKSMDQRPENEVFEFRLLATSDLRVADQELPCTHMAARCRRYVGTVGQADYYQFFSSATVSRGGKGAIAMPGGARAEIAVEDMCPFAFAAMVQRPLNERLSGGTGLEAYSIKGNPGLPGALRPYAEEKK